MLSRVFYLKVLFLAVSVILPTCSSIVPSHPRPMSLQNSLDTLVQEIYPDDQIAQGIARELFRLVDLHKQKLDPYLGKSGPGLPFYDFTRMSLGLCFNKDREKTDVILLNWTKPIPKQLTLHQRWSALSGLELHVAKGLNLREIATQVDDQEQPILESFFTYLPASLPKDHYLKKSADENAIPLLAPFKEWTTFDQDEAWRTFFKQMTQGIPNETRFASIKAMVIEIFLHETHHIGERNYRNKLGVKDSPDFGPDGDLGDFRKALKEEAFGRYLLAYYEATLKITATVKTGVSAKEQAKDFNLELGKLKWIIEKLNQNYASAFGYYKGFEYNEGFPEYVGNQSLIQLGLRSLSDEIAVLKDSSSTWLRNVLSDWIVRWANHALCSRSA